jgi:methylated-DNA-[protein]-cysteine S-methyltransferase
MHVAYENAKNSSRVTLANPRLLSGQLKMPAEHIAVITTAWGSCGVAWRDLAGIGSTGPCIDAVLVRIITPGLSLFDLRHAMERLVPGADEVLCDGHGHFHPETVPLWFGELVAALQGYFSNSMKHREEAEFTDTWQSWSPRLDLGGLTAFQRRVLELVARIPRGESRTYGQIARAAGKPGAARAVGAALRANPFPVLIPCHRVIGAGGKLTGFTAPGGISAKRRMLAMESGR